MFSKLCVLWRCSYRSSSDRFEVSPQRHNLPGARSTARTHAFPGTCPVLEVYDGVSVAASLGLVRAFALALPEDGNGFTARRAQHASKLRTRPCRTFPTISALHEL